MDTTYKLRMEAEELERWKAEAEASGMKLAAWIREKCNHTVEKEAGTEVPKAVIPKEEPRATFWDNTPIHRQHDKSCQCGVCDFARKAGMK